MAGAVVIFVILVLYYMRKKGCWPGRTRCRSCDQYIEDWDSQKGEGEDFGRNCCGLGWRRVKCQRCFDLDTRKRGEQA